MQKWVGAVLVAAALAAASVVHADGLEDIVKRGTLRVAVCEFAPWTFVNRAGQLEGSEIDIANAIAHDLSVKVEFKVHGVDEAIAAAAKGEVDLVAAGLAITPPRALQVEFSAPYFSSGISVATSKKLAPGVASAGDLNRKGYVVVTVADTAAASVAAELFDVAKVEAVPRAVDAERQLLEGRAHAYMASLPAVQILGKRHADVVELPLAKPVVGSVAGFAVQRGNQALLNYLDAWIASREADNWLPQTRSYWFDSYDWFARLKPAAGAR